MYQLDILLEDIGKFGLAQIIMGLMLSFYDVSIGMNALATVFIHQVPDSYRLFFKSYKKNYCRRTMVQDKRYNLLSFTPAIEN